MSRHGSGHWGGEECSDSPKGGKLEAGLGLNQDAGVNTPGYSGEVPGLPDAEKQGGCQALPGIYMGLGQLLKLPKVPWGQGRSAEVKPF